MQYLRFCILSALLCCLSCAVKRTQIRTHSDTQTISKQVYFEESDYKKFLLIGNTGLGELGMESTVKAKFMELAKTYGGEDYIVVLGDMMSMNENKPAAEHLRELFELLNSSKAKKLIVPGENEWSYGGTDGLRYVEEHFEMKLQDNESFQPEKGCPMETIDVGNGTELIVVDSQWYISNWDQISGVNDRCEIKNRPMFLAELKDKIKKAAHKNVVVVVHHPLYTNGYHGGQLPFSTWWAPGRKNGSIPIIGSLSAATRALGGMSSQDRLNPRMNELMTAIEKALANVPRAFVVSAHEWDLQYIEAGNIRQIISGAFGEVRATSLGKNGHFSSGRHGFAELLLNDNGASKVRFHGKNSRGEVVKLYEAEAFPKRHEYSVDSLPNHFPTFFRASVYPAEEVRVDKKFERWWGKHYRYAYGIKVKAPTAYLDTLYGGLSVERAGGGNQTLSLRLLDKEGKKFNMRALAKDPISFLQSSGYDNLDAEAYFSGTFPEKLISDSYTAAHPFGAFVIAALSHEIGLKHTHPKLFYVPKQAALGNFNEDHGDRLYMIEEKPDESFEDFHMFGRSDEVIDTYELLEELRDDEENRVDEREYIRARIFDMLLGDWDRHEGQWSWARSEVDGKKIYSPVPRDRDQVFANFDGKMIEGLQKIMGSTRQFGKYGPNIKYVEGFNESAINLDRAILQRSDYRVWNDQLAHIKQRLDRKNVERAFSSVPLEIQDETWREIRSDLLSRLDNLEGIIAKYQKYFLAFQTLKGTDKDDRFYLEYMEGGDIRVSAFRIKDGFDGEELFDRTFIEGETLDLWVYGLDDRDIFKVGGGGRSSIDVHLIGGLGDDHFELGEGHNITVHDRTGNEIENRSYGNATWKLNDRYDHQVYDHTVRPSKHKSVDFGFEYNPDEGLATELLLGTESTLLERNPFTSGFLLNLRYVPLTRAIDILPQASFANTFGNWNLKLAGRITSNDYTENFFGFGNSSTNVNSDFDINRISLQRGVLHVAAYRKGAYGSSFEFGAAYEHVSTEASQYVDVMEVAGNLNYLRLTSSLNYKALSETDFPAKGLLLGLKTALSTDLETSRPFVNLDPTITVYNALAASRRLVLKSQFIGQSRIGRDIPFHQAASIGSDTGLRAYRQNRFYGEQAVSVSNDFHFRPKPFKTFLVPLFTSFFGGIDIGRVWFDGRTNGGWHHGYGGGFLARMAGIFDFQVGYFRGPEGGRLSFALQFGK